MPDSLNILAIDTAMGSCAVAVRLRGAAAAVSRCVPMQHGHAAALVPMVQEVMREAGTGFDALDLIAVTIGPGSFTGIRTGLSTARALGLAHDVPVLGLTTLEVLARQATAARFSETYDGICVAIDSRRAEIFFQFFGKDGTPRSDPGMALANDIHFPENTRTLLVGDAAVRLAEEARGDFGIAEELSALDPEFLASLAGQEFTKHRKAGQTPPLPHPFYLRAPDVTAPGNNLAVTTE